MHDARSLISKSFSAYDAIVLVPPDPSTAQINRYFTIEFFYEVQQALKPGGVFEISLNTTANYMSNEEAETNAVLYNTLKPVFDAVIVMQGERNYFLASDSSLYMDISLRSKNSKIINEYVNEYFIDDDLLAQQSLMLLKEINTARYLINHDWQPYAYVSTIKQWLSTSLGNGAGNSNRNSCGCCFAPFAKGKFIMAFGCIHQCICGFCLRIHTVDFVPALLWICIPNDRIDYRTVYVRSCCR